MKRLIIMLAAMTAFLSSAPTNVKAVTDWSGWDLFIIAGQSNAEGVYTPIPAQNTFEQIQVFGVDYRWHVALEPCASQGDDSYVVDFINYNAAAGYGATKRFGIELRYLRPGTKVGLVNVARGGTSIATWQKTDYLNDETLYGAMVKRIRAASTRGTLRGIIWAQGEGDAIPANAATAQVYDTLLIQLISDLRGDIGNLPVVITGLGQNSYADTEYYPNWSLVDSKLYAAAQVIPNATYVSMSDVLLTFGPDQYHKVHYNVPGYNTLAARWATAMDELMGP